MDRISDSGSDGLGSNPDGSTKNAFIGIYRPYRGKKRGKVLQKTLPLFYFVLFHELGRASGNHRHRTYDMERKDSMYACRSDRADWYATLGDPFHLIRGGPERAVFRQFSSAKTF